MKFRLGLRRAGAWAGALLLLTLSACSETGDMVNERTGNRGLGYFSYVCVSHDDGACLGSTGLAAASFPAAVAHGARFRMLFQPHVPSPSFGRGIVAPVSSDYLTMSDGDVFKAIKPGYAGIVARSSVNSEVIDFTLVHIAPVSALRLDVDGAPAPKKLTIAAGNTAELRALPLGVSHEVLAGALPCLWSSSVPEIAAPRSEGPSSTVILDAVAEGMATVTVKAGELSVDLEVEVKP